MQTLVASQLNVLFGVQHLHVFDDVPLVVFDLETAGLQPVKNGLRLLQLGAPGCPILLIDYWELDALGRAAVQNFFTGTERLWLAHNAVFDLGWLQEHGINPKGTILCSMLASKLISNGKPNLKHGLAPVVQRYLDREISKELQASNWSAPTLTPEQLTYAANDVQALLDLEALLQQRLATAGLIKAWGLECGCLPAMAQMWRTGLPFNRTKLEALQGSLEDDIHHYGKRFIADLDEAMPEEHKLPRDEDGSFNLRTKAEGSVRAGTKRLAGFNLNSPKQLVEKLTILLGKVPVGKEGKPSAAREALREYAADHRVVQTYLLWKRAEKRRQMVVAMLEHQAPDGFIRASYMQLGAESGRMSCVKPNLQQVPRDNAFRAAAEAPEGWAFVCADFGQMELRLAAAIAKDATMIEAFKQGVDLHTLTADAIYTEPTEDEKELKLRRQVAKSANFGLLFGAGAAGLRNYAGAMGITMTIEEAEKVRDTFHQTYQGINQWQRLNAQTAFKTTSESFPEIRIPLSNMRRFLLGDMNRVTVRCNTPVQGAGAAIMKCALGKLWSHLESAGEEVARLSAVVHDEVLLLVKEGTETQWMTTLQQVMESAESQWLGEIPALAEANSGKTWADAK
jgi:DNA polymerase I